MFSRTLNFFAFVVVLIVRGCFGRTHNVTCRIKINYFLHLMRALCFYTIKVISLVFLNVYYYYVIT